MECYDCLSNDAIFYEIMEIYLCLKCASYYVCEYCGQIDYLNAAGFCDECAADKN
jgi:hypothetical protein